MNSKSTVDKTYRQLSLTTSNLLIAEEDSMALTGFRWKLKKNKQDIRKLEPHFWILSQNSWIGVDYIVPSSEDGGISVWLERQRPTVK
jgi:hypothetical protein